MTRLINHLYFLHTIFNFIERFIDTGIRLNQLLTLIEGFHN